MLIDLMSLFCLIKKEILHFIMQHYTTIFLVVKNADINIKIDNGVTTFDISDAQKYEDAEVLFKSHGTNYSRRN